ncbi:MAG: energy transducer TonB [Candidatus Cloacimonetes bacterium]|nr:energy transducer TonB [Candidatus Cloacimonadota bacterium]
MMKSRIILFIVLIISFTGLFAKFYMTDTAPELAKPLMIEYPELMLIQEISGTVVLCVEVLPDGKAGEISVMKSVSEGLGGLDQAAIDIIKKAEFIPATYEGKNVVSEINIPVNFEITPELERMRQKLIKKYRPDGSDKGKNIIYDAPPEIIFHVAPRYPRFAQKKRIQGTVLLDVYVDENGNATYVEVKKSLLPGKDGLDEAAIESIKKTKFKPALCDKKPIGVWVTIPIVFTLDKPNPYRF